MTHSSSSHLKQLTQGANYYTFKSESALESTMKAPFFEQGSLRDRLPPPDQTVITADEYPDSVLELKQRRERFRDEVNTARECLTWLRMHDTSHSGEIQQCRDMRVNKPSGIRLLGLNFDLWRTVHKSENAPPSH